MKKSILFLVITFLLTSITIAQDGFEYNIDGLNTDNFVVEVESKTKEELYERAVQWLKFKYNNPYKVIRSKTDNERLLIETIDQKAFETEGNPARNIKYTLELTFRDGRYRFHLQELSYITDKVPFNHPINFKSGEEFYNKKGEEHRAFRGASASITKYLNDLFDTLESIVKEGIQEKKDDW